MQRLRLNNQITAREVRVIDQNGQNLGVLSVEEALRRAREAGMDLIEISPTANPPVAKIMERGKYFYEQEKKRRQAAKKQKDVEIKSVRIGIGTSVHDLEIRAKQADEFLKEGNKIKVDLFLRGREKYLDKKFLQDRIERFLAIVSQGFEKEDIKKGPRGLSLTITPKK
ncbi:translation initiation factor IF-3 [Candidatus Giovannonibacteria bacterium RIFCSPLOWO2_12_FULL_44_25]|uniref:Translation initiation factor IF-3 n=3 Tax=Parcubacteria group TaxID=1794811 RepID=A0A1F5W927_9BACT|nr:MAG: translation initiation factor IF-3 [Candidatus Giovannonibacteria bacterium GWA2_45_15]OGF59782.1 MAG: translation initiation factor IF-3 [Candidatus Giovannonibacteria bacterium RIFCSPHIGHO2_01_45_12]OGF60990.1 MAG: translation initiation factor IF-3 [Candidatus Giovannonibacteria bacterium RIFCSPHIGHO2_01_FULL_44_100]OGF72165.1 MAG: translation initiation factor IF-3 [Candidatus Giovannonibacteria bacterium RIFCSPHIGHO2_02_FULL_45_40]OGF84556.1 MAG: translation initiation factor IF-3 